MELEQFILQIIGIYIAAVVVAFGFLWSWWLRQG
jgi:hypothetical protein